MTRTPLDGKTVVVTGGAGGIGQACTRRLLEDGATVAVIDPNLDGLEAVKRRCADRSRVVAIRSNLESPASCAAALREVEGSIYALVHLAGAFDSDGLDPSHRPVWDRMIATNLTTAFDMAAECARRFDAAVVSRMVFATSVAYRRGSVGHLGYSAAKGGISALVRALARQLAPAVLVNGVAPGVIKTRMTEALIEDRGDKLAAEIPLRRWGEANEVASVIAFLCSSDASYVTGQIINVDGGMVNS